MRRTVCTLGVALSVGIALGAIGTQVLSAQYETTTRAVLLRTDLEGIEGKEGIMMVAVIAPGAETGKHIHPGHEFAYVLEGSGTLEIEGKPSIALKPGTAIYQPPGQVHNGRNASATAPLRILVLHVSEKDKPDTIPVK
jgi:quercetin dioxygenase-like cupin family protein